MNRLPEKLHLLRKSSGLTQSEIASKLMVPVAEYMNWENGNSIPSIDQLKQISLLFHVDLSALIDNTMTFVAPAGVNTAAAANGASATIPFANKNDVNATQPLEDGTTKQFNAADATGSTKELTATADLSNVKEDNDLGDKAHTSKDQKGGTVNKNKTVRKTVKKKKKSTKWIIAVCAIAAAVIVAIIVIMNLNIGAVASTDNGRRLILTDEYSMYVNDDGDLESHGENYSSVASALADSVQIDAYGDDLAAGVKADGTVVTTDSSLDTSSWEDITMVAAGSDHVVGLKSDGTVECTGNSSACVVDDWTDVSEVYAGDGITIALTSDGSFLSSGGVGIPDVSGVKAVAITDSVVYYETSSGTVKTISLSSDASALATSSLSGVKYLAASDSILAGLNSDGTVVIECDDDDVTSAVETWENVVSIAVEDDTIVAYTESGKMYGAGPNDNGQYVNTAGGSAATITPTASATASATTAAQQLDSVTNITFETTTKSLQISWDAVSNASYYTVSISPNIGTLAKATGTSVSVPASSLSSGTTYTVSITAHASDSDTYADSDTVNVTYTYEAKTIQLGTPGSITGSVDDGGGWTISWGAVDNADSYSLYIDGNLVNTQTQTYYTFAYGTVTDGSHTITVVAHSSDSTYSDSAEGSATLTYSYEVATPTPTSTAEPTAAAE